MKALIREGRCVGYSELLMLALTKRQIYFTYSAMTEFVKYGLRLDSLFAKDEFLFVLMLME